MKRTKRFLACLLAFAMLLSLCVGAADVQEEEAANGALIGELAGIMAENSSPADWIAFDLAACGEQVSDAQKEAMVAAIKEAVTSEYAAVTDFAQALIIFAKLREDISVLEVDVAEKINATTEYATYASAIWALIADSFEEVSLSDEQKRAAVAKISENMNESGMLFGSYGGYTYDDPDSTGAAVGAMEYLIDEADTYGANAVFEKMISALSAAQTETGSYGSACTDAFVIIGLCAAGIDADSDERFIKGENSLMDGLLSYVTEGGLKGYDGNVDIAWSTEQGLRALIAYRGFKEAGGAYNLYYTAPEAEEDGGDESGKDEDTTTSQGGGLNADISKNEQSGGSAPDISDEGNEEQAKLITVTFEMLTHEDTWISAYAVELRENATVKELIAKVFSDYGVASSGLSSGYLRSVTFEGEKLGEFDRGPGSGWQYFVNKDLPQIGISDYKLSDGDFVSLRYTADYADGDEEHKEPVKSEEGDKAAEEETEQEIEPAKTNPYSDVAESDWYFESVMKAEQLGLMKGVGENSFAPQSGLTRAMFVTVLYRIEGSPEAEESSVYKDVKAGSWYAAAVSWASKNGIVNGTGAQTFSPDAAVTREQMAALAWRYAKYKGKAENSGTGAAFADSSGISEYAKEAVSWADSAGIMSGSGGSFRPREGAKRCEAAAVFVRLYDAIIE